MAFSAYVHCGYSTAESADAYRNAKEAMMNRRGQEKNDDEYRGDDCPHGFLGKSEKPLLEIFLCSLDITHDGLYTMNPGSMIDLMESYKTNIDVVSSGGPENSYIISPNGRQVCISAFTDSYIGSEDTPNLRIKNTFPLSAVLFADLTDCFSDSDDNADCTATSALESDILSLQDRALKRSYAQAASAETQQRSFLREKKRHVCVFKRVTTDMNCSEEFPAYSSDGSKVVFLSSDRILKREMIKIYDFVSDSLFSISESPAIHFTGFHWGLPEGGEVAGPHQLFATGICQGELL